MSVTLWRFKHDLKLEESIWKGEEGAVRQVFIIDRRSRLRIEVKVLKTEV